MCAGAWCVCGGGRFTLLSVIYFEMHSKIKLQIDRLTEDQVIKDWICVCLPSNILNFCSWILGIRAKPVGYEIWMCEKE